MKDMGFWRHTTAYVSLGLLCGWYYFLFFALFPSMYFLLKGSWLTSSISIMFMTTMVVFDLVPIKHVHNNFFLKHWIWNVWIEYFEMTFDVESTHDMKKKKCIYLEFPHGIFPVGQFVSASFVYNQYPDVKICGTGADVIFKVPVMRQIMSWIGTHPANKKSIKKIFEDGHQLANIPGGIAEMYHTNDSTEEIYFLSRKGIIKIALEEGADIIPTFFFGNSKLFKVLGGQGSDSWVAKLSRRLKASIFFFYGRHGLPVPIRHPLRMVTGEIISVTQTDNPSQEDIDSLHGKVVDAIKKLYNEKKPEWETRPLIIK